MWNVSQYLCLILASLFISGCAWNDGYRITSSLREEPPKIPSTLYWDVEQMIATPRCSKPIEVVGDFEDCYKELLSTIQYIDRDRCYRVEQHQQTIWVSSKGTQLINLPDWCTPSQQPTN